MAHPASSKAGHQPALRLHLPVTQGHRGRDTKGQDAVSTNGHEPAVRCPAAQAQPEFAGLVRLLPARRVACCLQIPQPLRVGSGHRMAASQTPQDYLEGTPPPFLRQRMVADRAGKDTVRPRDGAHDALPIPGRSDPDSLADHGMRTTTIFGRGLWRARCLVTGTPGSGGGSGRPTGGNTGRAPRTDLTSGSAARTWP